MRLPIAIVLLGVGFTALSATAGELVYKSTMPDGSVMYGEGPQPGARKVEKIAAATAPTGTVVVTPQDKARAESIHPRGPSVGVMPQPAREPAARLESGTMSPPGAMPKRAY